MSRVIVFLDEVYCSDTEDVTGADEFYILGAISTADGAIRQAVALQPIPINNGQSYNYGGIGIFDRILPETAILNIELNCFDEDSSGYSSSYAQALQAANQAVQTIPPLTPLGQVAPAIIQAVNSVIGLDDDDQLYYPYLQGFPIWLLPYGDSFYQFFSQYTSITFYSDWSYRVRFRIGRYQT